MEIFKQNTETSRYARIREHNGAWLLQVYASYARRKGQPMVEQFFFPTLQDARFALRRHLAK